MSRKKSESVYALTESTQRTTVLAVLDDHLGQRRALRIECDGASLDENWRFDLKTDPGSPKRLKKLTLTIRCEGAVIVGERE